MNVDKKLLAAIRAFVDEAFHLQEGQIFFTTADEFPRMRDLIFEADKSGDIVESDIWSMIFDLFPHPFSSAERAGSGVKALGVEGMTNAIADSLRQIPAPYTIFISLPAFRVVDSYRFAISDKISLFASEESVTYNGIVGRHTEGPPPTRRLAYLAIEVDGYFAPRQGRSAVLDRAWAILRQCMYFFGLDGGSSGSLFAEGEASTHVVNRSGQKFSVSAPPGLAEYVGRLELAGGHWLGVPEGGGTALFSKSLHTARAFYWQAASSDRERLAAAMEWLLDSRVSSDQTMAYLSGCIGLESLLGEDGSELNTQRLEDRYSYLLGKTRSARKALAAEMREIFTIRGHLVHARASRLRGRDLRNLMTVQRMLSACLSRELDAFLESDRLPDPRLTL